MQLAEYGKKILERRKQFIKQVNDIIADIHYKLTGGKERITLTYESSLGNITFETALSKYRERDLRMKSTTVGPHRDDICFTTDAGLDIRKFGSQGQQRTAALSLKLSEIELVKEELNVKNVKFTDEVREFTSYTFKPQLKTVGPKYGKLLGGIKAALSSLDGNAAMDELNEKEALKLEVNGCLLYTSPSPRD